MNPDISQLRENYTRAGLDRADLDPDPILQFDRWFQQALAARLIEPNAMTLATAGADGQPAARTVLLKAFDQQGFVFYTNYTSAKAGQLTQNPRAALCFPWLALERQVIIAGSVEKVSRAESLRYFLSRPHGSQLGAWVSPQSSVISSRQILEMKFAEIARNFSAGKVPLPDAWGGYRVIPLSLEFWQGRPNRLHDRFRYRRPSPSDPWTLERLAP